MRALVLVALLLAPTALGQLAVVPATLTVFIEDPGRAFIPGTNETVSVVVNYAPGQGGRPAPAPTAERPEDTEPTRITFAPKDVPSWITQVTFDPPEILVYMGLNRTGQGTLGGRTQAILTVSPDAPALERELFTVTATAQPNGNIAGATSDSSELKFRATTIGKLNITSEPTAIIPGGRWTTIPFYVRNEGNSDIVAKINVTTRPENSQVEFTNTLELKRNETRTIEVRLRTPWTGAEFGTLELEAAPIVDSEEGTAARAEVSVLGESAVPLPTLGPILALAAVALLARRARRDA